MTEARGNIIKMLKLLFGFGWWSPIGFVTKSTALIGINMLRIADHKPEAFQPLCGRSLTWQNLVLSNPQWAKSTPTLSSQMLMPTWKAENPLLRWL